MKINNAVNQVDIIKNNEIHEMRFERSKESTCMVETNTTTSRAS